MTNGVVISIHIAKTAGSAMISLEEAQAVAGRGLVGDRYFSGEGTFSKKSAPDREITLIELEAIQALERDYQITLAPGQARRSIVTRGVALNRLVNRKFKVGAAVLKGLRLCEPCQYLENLTHRGVVEGLIHRGGLRAQILRSGKIRPGDKIKVLKSPTRGMLYSSLRSSLVLRLRFLPGD